MAHTTQCVESGATEEKQVGCSSEVTSDVCMNWMEQSAMLKLKRGLKMVAIDIHPKKIM